MTGKTHFMVGGAASLALLPITIPQLVVPSFQNMNILMDTAKGFASLIVLAVVIWIISRAPDLDKPGSSIAKDIAGPFGANRASAFLGGLLLVFISRNQELPIFFEQVRPYLLYSGEVLILMAILRHRGATHSIWGVLAAWYGFNTLLQYLAQEFPEASAFLFHDYLSAVFLLNYGAHILVDLCSDEGVFLFYIPFVPATHKRIRIPTFIRTNSLLDVVVIRMGCFFYIAYTVGYQLLIGG